MFIDPGGIKIQDCPALNPEILTTLSQLLLRVHHLCKNLINMLALERSVFNLVSFIKFAESLSFN
jgi:hypothetical protein